MRGDYESPGSSAPKLIISAVLAAGGADVGGQTVKWPGTFLASTTLILEALVLWCIDDGRIRIRAAGYAADGRCSVLPGLSTVPS